MRNGIIIRSIWAIGNLKRVQNNFGWRSKCGSLQVSQKPSWLCHLLLVIYVLPMSLYKCVSSCVTHTHTHTHVGFYGLRGLSIGVMVFILYKLYVLLPYTYPTPKLSPHRRRCISTFPQKNSLCMIYKRFKLWGHWKCPHKSPSPCNTYVIPMSL